MSAWIATWTWPAVHCMEWLSHSAPVSIMTHMNAPESETVGTCRTKMTTTNAAASVTAMKPRTSTKKNTKWLNVELSGQPRENL